MERHAIGVYIHTFNWVADCSCGWSKATIGARDAQRLALKHHRERQGIDRPPMVTEDGARRFLGALRSRERAEEAQDQPQRSTLPAPGRSWG